MRAGTKVIVQPNLLSSTHPGIRFDSSQGAAAALSAPKGASGEVLRTSDDGRECLVELYWNAAPRAAPGAGHTWRVWVKREWFGQLFLL